MEEKLLKKQMLRLFLGHLLSFALLFTLLFVVVFQVTSASMYSDVDASLKKAVSSSASVAREINFLNNDGTGLPTGKFPSNRPQEKPDGDVRDPQQVVLLWDKDGNLLNEKALGVRFSEYAQVALQTDNLNQITSITYTDDAGTKRNLHEIVSKATNAALPSLAYVQVLVNTDQITTSMKSFRFILLMAMILAFLVAVFASYFLARRALKPILVSWEKQQEFVANASHELRTPLAVMQSQLEGLFLHPDEKIIDASEPIATTLSEIRRLTKLSNDLLLLARFDAKQQVSEKVRVTTDDFLKKIFEPYQELAQSEGKTLTLQTVTGGTALIDVDQIRQLLLILLDNALKFTAAGDTITLQSEVTEKNWLLKVSDTGSGFQTANLEEIFTRFYREDTARSTKGNGLGLAIAKTIVTSHGGTIKASRNLPKGAIFLVSIPRKK